MTCGSLAGGWAAAGGPAVSRECSDTRDLPTDFLSRRRLVLTAEGRREAPVAAREAIDPWTARREFGLMSGMCRRVGARSLWPEGDQ